MGGGAVNKGALSPNPEIMQEWAERLESGKYKQGRGALRRDDGTFCCLGVLCEIAVEAGVIPQPIQTVWTGGKFAYDGQTNLLPESVFTWAGLPNMSPVFSGHILANANDQGTTFSSIATWVRLMAGVSHGPLPEPQAQVQNPG